MNAAAVSFRDDRETELLSAVAQGNRRALEKLYGIYHQRLLRFLMRLAPRHEIAEEVINDTFWIVWQKAKEFRGASRVSTWIMGIAYRRALKVLRCGRTSLPSVTGSAAAEAMSISEPHQETEQRDWILQGLQRLPPEQRTSIELAYYLGHSCEEIAQIMDCGVPTVKARMFHARAKLRSSLPQLAGALSVAVLCLVAAVWVASPYSDAPYRTLTSSAPATRGAVIHVVFDPALPPSEIQVLLERARVKIVAGPTPGGMYSLALQSTSTPAAVQVALSELRTHRQVRFAEPIAETSGE